MFEKVEKGPPDPMYVLKRRADGDTCPEKVDLGVGIYRNEEGLYQELDCVHQAKIQLAQNNPGHDYEITTGDARFLSMAARVMLGEDCERLLSNQVASVQTISGTGAVHLGALLLSHCSSPRSKVYVGTPAWGNYKPIFQSLALDVFQYQYYNSDTRAVDFASVLSAAGSAPPGSIFVLQGCCHNPTGADLSPSQWDELALVMQARNLFPFFDVAYQGLGNGLAEDAYAVRHFAAMGFEMFVCQSFSKNFGLYGERCGALHAICKDPETRDNVFDRLRCLIRWEFSSSPAFGSRLVSLVLGSGDSTQAWMEELCEMRERLKRLREQLYTRLVNDLKTPGNWENIKQETGLFSYSGLTPAQCDMLINQHHVYLPPNGRINVSGLNEGNINRVAKAINQVVRVSTQPQARLA